MVKHFWEHGGPFPVLSENNSWQIREWPREPGQWQWAWKLGRSEKNLEDKINKVWCDWLDLGCKMGRKINSSDNADNT